MRKPGFPRHHALLLGDDDGQRLEEFLSEQQLSRFGPSLRGAAAGEPEQMERVERAKRAVEVARCGTRRPDGAHRARRGQRRPGRDGVRGSPAHHAGHRGRCTAVPRRDALSRAVRGPDPMPFWKFGALSRALHARLQVPRAAGPGPRHARSAGQDRRCAPATRCGVPEGGDAAVVGKHRSRGSAKLRELVGELIDQGLWRLLWMPPTLPYWPLEGPFEGKEHATKRLLFSAWNLVPDVVSAVLSYEAERLMMGGRLDSYDNPDAQQRPLLRAALRPRPRGRRRAPTQPGRRPRRVQQPAGGPSCSPAPRR